jgi:hypothetical protein
MYDSAFTVFISLLMVHFVGMEAVYQRAKWTGSGLRYPVGIALRATLRVGGPLIIYASYKILQEGTTRLGMVITVLIGCLGIACILGEPGEITTSLDGIKCRKYFGLQKKFIPWGSVVASYLPAIREVLVIGKNGVHFAHTQYHVGQDEFVRELRRHGVFFHGDPINGNPRNR